MSGIFASQFSWGPEYTPESLQPGVMGVSAKLPGKAKAKEPTNSPTSPAPTPPPLPVIPPLAPDTSNPAESKTPNYSVYFDQTPNGPHTLAPNPAPSPAPAQPVDNNPLGAFGHWTSHTFDSARHGAATVLNDLGGIISQEAGAPNKYSPTINNSGGWMAGPPVPNYQPNNPGVSVPRGWNAQGGFSLKPPATVNPQQFNPSAAIHPLQEDVTPVVPNDIKSLVADARARRAAQAGNGPVETPTPEINAPKAQTDWSRYFAQPQNEGAPVINPNVSTAQFGRQAANEAGNSWESDIGTFLRDLGQSEGE